MGLFFLYSASQEDFNTVMKQSIFVGFGLILMFAVSQLDPDFYKTFSGFFLLTSIILILATIVFVKEINVNFKNINISRFIYCSFFF